MSPLRCRALSVLVLAFLASPPLHAGVDLAPRPPAVAPYGAAEHDVAFAGDRFLTVWRSDHGEAGSHILGALSDRNGRRISEVAFPISTFSHVAWLDLVDVDRGFVLFWRESYDPNFTTHMVDIDQNGSVGTSRRLSLPPHISAAVAWNGRAFLVAMEHPAAPGRSASAVLMDRGGNVIGRPVVLGTPSGDAVKVVAADDAFVVVMVAEMAIVSVYRIAADGTTTVHRMEDGQRASAAIATHLGGGNVLVLSRLTSADRGIVLEWSIFAASGTRTPVRRLTLTREVLLMPDAVTRDGAGYRLWYSGWDVQAKRQGSWSVKLDPNGDLFDPTVVDVTESIGTAARVATADGIVFVAGIDAATDPSRARVVSAKFGPDAAFLHSDVLSRLPVRQHDPRVESAPGAFLAAWTESSYGGSSTRAVLLDGRGARGSVFTIAADTMLVATAVASSGEVLAVTSRGDSLLATRIASYGRALDASPIVLTPAARPIDSSQPRATAVWAGDRWLVAWAAGDKMYIAAVLSSGVVMPPRELAFNVPLTAGWTRYPLELRLAFDGREILLVWREIQGPPCMMPVCASNVLMHVARMDASGAPVDHIPLQVQIGSNAERLDVSSGGGGEFVVLLHGGSEAVAIGVRTGGNTLIVDAPRQLFAFPGRILGDIAWDGVEHVVALRYCAFTSYPGHPFPAYLMLHRLNSAGVDMTLPRGITVDLPDSHGAAPSVAGGRSGTMIVLHETRPGDSARAVAYAEHEMRSLPARPSRPRNVSALRLGPSQVQVSWDAADGADGYIIEVEVSPNVFTFNTLVPARLRTATITSYGPSTVVRVRAFNASGAGAASERTTAGGGAPRRRVTRSSRAAINAIICACASNRTVPPAPRRATAARRGTATTPGFLLRRPAVPCWSASRPTCRCRG